MAAFASSRTPAVCLLALIVGACVASEPTGETAVEGRVGDTLQGVAADSLSRQDYGAALIYYKTLYDRRPHDPAVVVGLSRTLRQLSRADEAHAILRRALQTAPRDPALLGELGKVQLSLDEPLKAVESLSKADALGAPDWSVLNALGVGYDRLGLYPDAERRYRQALELAPGTVTTMNNLALSLAQAKRLDEAVPLMEQAASLPEATSQVRQNLAMLYAMQGNLRKVEPLLRRDLDAETVAHNLAYYRRLNAGAPVRPVLSLDAADETATPLGVLPPPLGAGPPVAAAAAPVPPVLPVPPPPVSERPAAVSAASIAAAADRALPPPPRADAEPAEVPAPALPAPIAAAPPPPAAVPATAAALQPARPAFRLQLGSFRSDEAARAGLARLRSGHDAVLDGLALDVARADLGERGVYYRVVSEPLASREAARDMCERLRAREAVCIVVGDG